MSIVEFEAKIEDERFVLSVEEDLGAIYNFGHRGVTSVHDLIGDIPEFAGSLLFLFSMSWTAWCFLDLFAAIEGRFESSKDQTTSLLAVYIKIAVLVSYGCSALRDLTVFNEGIFIEV